MKKLALGLIPLGLLSFLPAAYADVSVPSLPGGFEATIVGLYLNASSNNLNYLTQSLTQNPNVYQNFNIDAANAQSINLGYQWGFMLGVGYLFPNTGNDVQIDWTHLNTGNQSGPTVYQNPEYTADFGGGVTFDIVSSETDNGQASLDDDAVDFDFGQYIDVGNSLTLRAFAGLRYLDLDQTLGTSSNMYMAQTETGGGNYDYSLVTAATSSFHSDFDGIGPLLGVDSHYALGGGVGVQVDADSALLMGSERDSGALAISQAYTALQTAPVTSSAIQNIPSFSQTRIVTALDGKLGLDYSRNIHDVDFTLAGGYQVSEYFNALDRINADSATFFAANNVIIPEDGGVFTPIPVSTHAGNVGIDGPYLSLTIKA